MLQSSTLLQAESQAKITPTDYIIMFMMLAISGNPLFYSKYVAGFALIAMTVILLLRRKLKVNLYAVLVMAAFGVLFLLQYTTLRRFSLLASINFEVKLLLAYFCIVYFGVKFRPAYLNVMYVLCIISLFGFLITAVLGYVPLGIRVGRAQSWFVFNVLRTSTRNSGMFWEPGAFAGYICLTFLLYINEIGYLWKHDRKKFIVLVVTLITTRSTTGFIVLAYIFGMFFIGQSKKKYAKLLLLPILVAVSFYAYQNLKFLGDKIQDQIEEMEEYETGEIEYTWTRTGSMLIDIDNLRKHPFVGNGFIMEQKYEGLGEKMNGAGNGLSSMFNSLGIPAMLLVLFLVGYRQRALTPFMRLAFVGGYCLMLFGENFLGYTVFTSMIFYGDYVKRVRTNKLTKIIDAAPTEAVS